MPLLLWNIVTTLWIYNATVRGAILIHAFNPLLLTLPFFVLRFARRRLGDDMGYFAFICSWLTLEYFHHSWQFAFPFLTLGNSLAMRPSMIQFYEYTGVLGGSLWILLVNVGIFHVIRRIGKGEFTIARRKFVTVAAVLVFILVAPALISLLRYRTFEELGQSVEVVVIHPNTDCLNEKYAVEPKTLIKKYLNLTFDKITTNTDYVIWPETAIVDGGWVEKLSTNATVKQLIDTLKLFPKSKLVTGAIMYEMFHPTQRREKPEDIPNLKFSKKSNAWYYTYNAALQLANSGRTISMRTKQKLVPIEETVPYMKGFGIVRKMVHSLGGYLFTRRPTNNDLFLSKNGYNATTLICYESIFGNLTANYVDKGANLLFIVLNEGWYRSSQGARQFMYLASLRAIENRRSIARSSNDGISCFINQKGEIFAATGQFAPKAILGNLMMNRMKTFYTRFGDYLGVIALVFLGGMLVVFFIRGANPG